MTTFTGADEPVISFDCDGTLTDKGETVIGQDGGQRWDLNLLRWCLDTGCRVVVSTCNVPEYVARQLALRGYTAYADTNREFKVPPLVHPITGTRRYVLVTNLKPLADVYFDDHAYRFTYGDRLAPVLEFLSGTYGLSLPPAGKIHRDGGTGRLVDAHGYDQGA